MNASLEESIQIISGGQTGADRAALDFALDKGFSVGGWCPAGRRSEDGSIPVRYPLIECESPDYRVRTRKNIVESHGTVLFFFDKLTGGSALTEKICLKQGRPLLCLDGARLAPEDCAGELCSFVNDYLITILNVAGPRASGEARVYDLVYEVLCLSFSQEKT
ncbi:MAG: putative molybdenum carrier protein [Planctomycetes bacterium]|nr:putative molybdenum carrier protein [Planctomycetota bacterium]